MITVNGIELNYNPTSPEHRRRERLAASETYARHSAPLEKYETMSEEELDALPPAEVDAIYQRGIDAYRDYFDSAFGEGTAVKVLGLVPGLDECAMAFLAARRAVQEHQVKFLGLVAELLPDEAQP